MRLASTNDEVCVELKEARMNPHFTLSEEMIVDDLASLALQLEAVLIDSPETIDIDATRLEYVDTAGLQLLYAFARDAHKAGKRIVWHGVRPEVAESARVLGMLDELDFGAGQ